MDNTIEKLIELIDEAEEHSTDICVYNSDCEDCPGRKYGNKCREYLKADHLIANGVTVQKWIPVTERLPRPYVDVIALRTDLLSGKYHVVGLEYITLHGEENLPGWSKDHMTWKNKVTHWMPLPESPKGE